MKFSGHEKRILLSLAEGAIIERLAPGRKVPFITPDLPEKLRSCCGAFVSIYVDGELRGCIGTFSEEEPLYKNVTQMAVSAACNDSRFDSIQADDLDRLSLEISVLSPRQKIRDPSEIIIGLHGIYIRQGAHRGTLLPQVAVNQNWSAVEFLSNCSKYKAGLGWDGWKTAELYTYEALVFNSGMPSF